METTVKMWQVQCEICGKEIIGWHKSHAEYLLEQHKTAHSPLTNPSFEVRVEDIPKKSWRQRREERKLMIMEDK